MSEQTLGTTLDDPPYFDKDNHEDKQLPRTAAFKFEERSKERDNDKKKAAVLMLKAHGSYEHIGREVRDQSDMNDGYRYHDAFHLANMAVLRWSPTYRNILACRRDGEDDTFATFTDEGIVVAIFNNARDYSYFVDTSTVPRELLRYVSNMGRNYEVRQCSLPLWEKAILAGCAVFRKLYEHSGGYIDIDLAERRISYRRL